ncbi:MAG: hypothetical protein EPO07_13770 [Verrucomicrobia bacterium]|nr:MAG: hypothetical protein EPO07_13770 [Verrucomicrobiota bacterium]
MRPRILISVTLALLGLLAVLMVSTRNRRLAAGDEGDRPGGRTLVAMAPTTALALPVAEETAVVLTNARAAVTIMETNHEEYVEQRVAELMDLAMNDDANSLSAILTELTNPDKRIRKGALEAAVQFGDRTITPRLQELAAQTEEAEEKAALLAAVDYLNLPSLTEYLAGHAPRTNASLPLRNTNRVNRGVWPGTKPKQTAPTNAGP